MAGFATWSGFVGHAGETASAELTLCLDHSMWAAHHGINSAGNPGRNIMGIAGAICSGLAANCEFDLAINYRAPLAFVAVRGQIDILQDLEEYQQAFAPSSKLVGGKAVSIPRSNYAASKWTALMLLRFRYRLAEATEGFPEGIVLAAFDRGGNIRLLVLRYGRSSFASA